MISFLSRLLSNERGSAIYVAMVAGGLLLSGLLLTQQMSQQSSKMARVARVKSAVNAVAAKATTLAHTSRSYTGCDSQVAGKCKIIKAAFDSLGVAIPGADCMGVTPTPVFCGVEVQNVELLNVNQFRADVVYTGRDVVMHPVHIEVKVPAEVLQEEQYSCGTGLFKGFNADFTVKCDPLPPDCPAGQFITEVNPKTLKPNCQSIPKDVNCRGGLIGGFKWVAGSYQADCIQRLSPFDYYKFVPDVKVSP